MEFIHFKGLQTSHVDLEKLKGDHKTGWIGEGFTKFAVLVCDMLKLEFGTHC